MYSADEAQYSGCLRTLYFDRDFQDDQIDRIATTQAIRLNYFSPSLGMFKVGTSLWSSQKLSEDGDSHLIGSLNSESNSYTKLGQLYIDAQLNENTKVRLGRWVTGKALINDDDSRSTPPSTQAVMIESKLAGANVFVLYSDRASSKTEEEFEKYTDANGDDYAVALVGATTQLENGLSLSAEYGQAGNFSSKCISTLATP